MGLEGGVYRLLHTHIQTLKGDEIVRQRCEGRVRAQVFSRI